MCPRTSFPLWREKGLREGIQTSPHPRTDPNYRFGLSQSQSTFHQIILECIHSPPQQNKQKHTFTFCVNCWWLEMILLEGARKSCWNHISQFWLGAHSQKVQADYTQNSQVAISVKSPSGWTLSVLRVVQCSETWAFLLVPFHVKFACSTSVWGVLSRSSSFLPQSKNTNTTLISGSKLPIAVSV